jgi:phosphomannomutase
MSTLIRSISGIRGIVGNGLSPEEIIKYSSAFAEYCDGGSVIVGFDGRPSGIVISKIVTATLQSSGVHVVDLGMVPTPTVQMKVELSNAAGGISITASHNPSEWNGLKFLDSTGIFLDAEQNRELFKLADEGAFSYKPWSGLGSCVLDDAFTDDHINAVLSLPLLNTSDIQSRKFKVVLDAVNASGSFIIKKLLQKLNCEVIPVACDGSGIFPHTPEPLPENLISLGEAVREHKADMGIAIDPDGDRLVLFNELGEPYGEEYTITTAVDSVLSSSADHERGPVVVNLSTTRAVEDVATNYAVDFIRTPVGEINVVKKMKAVGAIVGGEGSGGVILPMVHAGRDALVGSALVLNAFARFDGPLSAYKATLPQYEIRKLKYDLANMNADLALERAADIYANERINTEDGVRIDFEEGWVHLRKSNTEPIIRAIAESVTGDQAIELARRVTTAAFA